MNEEKIKMCGLCKRPANDGKHKFTWVETTKGIRFEHCECPYYVGFNGQPVIFIPENEEDELILADLKKDLYRRQQLLEQL